MFAAGQRDAGFVERGDAGAEPGLHAELAQCVLDDGAGTFAHVGRDRAVAIDDDDAHFGVLAEDLAKPRGHFRCRLDAGETAAGNDNRVAPVHGRPVGEALQMLVEGNRIVERVDTEAVLGKAGDIRTEQPAAGGDDQPVVGESLSRALGGGDLHHARLGIDRLGAALHIDDVDGLEDIQQRRCQGLGFRFIEPRANHQRRLRRDQRDLEFVGRHALDVAQTGCGKCGVHAGEAGAYDDYSHVFAPLV